MIGATMVNDSIVNTSASTKDFAKKKRANRSAKLKQCKLDARREQWLSQGKNKVLKEETNGNGGEGQKRAKAEMRCCKGLEVRSVSVEDIHNHDSDSETSSPTNSPLSVLPGSGNNYAAGSSTSSSASTASFGSGGCCSGSITEEEEGGGGEFGDDDDGCLDDWEVMADALVGASTDDNQSHDPSSDQNLQKEADTLNSHSASPRSKDASVDVHADGGKSDSVGILGTCRVNNKAWRSDDASRPQCLPNLAKQRSFPANSERLPCHGLNPWDSRSPCVPMSCPICCEDLDLTDSSFLPCPCGFHLCLFCHKRILEEDGRCPGCRKPYASDTTVTETGVQLARSCSMFSRV